MSSYRKMRHQARQARRSGLQPMMVLNTGDQFPDSLGAVLARGAWRYRSELAPVALTAGILATAIYLHRAWQHRWGLILGPADASAWLLLVFGARMGLAPFMERVYAAITTVFAGTWLALAIALGPFRPPLPQCLVIGSFVLAIPWWAHRRRRARVRVERKLEAWPDIAKAVGLAGSEVMSAIIDVWGWRARFRLARGQTITDVIAKIPAIESGLGTFRGAVRVYPTPDDLANRCEIRVLDIDPHAGAIPWPGPSVTSITQPIDLGPFEDATPCKVVVLRRHGLFAGTTGSGKSGGINALMGNLAACNDVVVWAIDLKKGMELGPWAPCIGRLATTPEQAIALLRDAVAVLEARAQFLAARKRRLWEPSPTMPALIIIIDEYAELKEAAPDAMGYTDSIARLGRALAVTLIAATQRPTQKAMGEGAVRSQMDIRICFRVREGKDVDLVLGQGMLRAGWTANTLNAPGKFLVSSPENDSAKRARAYLLTDEVVGETAARFAATRPQLDEISQRALDRPAAPMANENNSTSVLTPQPSPTDETKLWQILHSAPEQGLEISELMKTTGMKRTKLYRHLQALAESGQAEQVSRGRWRGLPQDGPSL